MIFESEKITQYNHDWYQAVDDFIHTACEEGSAGTYTKQKLDLDNLDPLSSLWLSVVNNTVVSISYAQRSFITGTPESIRKCRYHILKNYRRGRFGFKMMKHQIAWAKSNGFKHYYWTHDVKDHAINQLFQHKKTYSLGDNDNQYFRDPDFLKLTLEKQMVFRDTPKSDMIQFVYSYYIDPAYKWQPTKSVINFSHQGQIDDVNKVIG